jgi:hypothetical protein
MEVRTFLRQRDYSEAKELLEDKLFVVVGASIDAASPVSGRWKHGKSVWMTEQELQKQSQYFPLTSKALRAFENATFSEFEQIISPDHY